MMEKTVTISSSLDARQAAFFVQTAGQFNSNIQIAVGEKKVNAKSIMGTIALGMTEGQVAVVSAEGADEQLAVEELTKVLS